MSETGSGSGAESRTTTAPSSTTGSGCGTTRSGCVGCLGSLVMFTFIGSIFFGGGILMRVGQWSLNLGNPVETNQIIANYLDDLASKAKIADEAVQQFHTQLNQGKCQEIYGQAAEVFKSKTNQSSLVNLCTEIKSKLGSVKSTERTDWWGQPAEQGGSYVLTRYDTKLSKSTAQETFTWLVKDGKSQLASYQIFPGQVISSKNPASPNISPSPTTSP
jgi:hypothetical protein